MEDLVGKTINSVFVNRDDTILIFDTDAGIIAYETEGVVAPIHGLTA